MKPTFEMKKDEYGGVEMIYTTSGGNKSSTYYPSPPEDIDQVCLQYMKGRFKNVRTWKQVDFIKQKYKEAYQTLFNVMDELKVGDKVVMHSCLESKRYQGKVWTCKTEQFKAESGSNVVFLEGYSGYFLVKYLQRVRLTEN
ncbi:hypothetical protein [Stenotrophomonas maltophilia group sp. RNC7]|uniref:hypothetical protein n=1 Tax=Stenotrophomonas maltophilia group sp. RNC7 TaxID=3071467 RepID=UPI0027E10D48|nr:hypothetical protein [Stenotrophomonas maltophilia group sp. RNC7]MDQ4679348.1 hypothetical protein [Stenotrophomonas maltophilia group sp. RNC7]